MAFEKIKILGAILELPSILDRNANLAHLPGKWAELVLLFSWQLQHGPQDFDFFKCHGCQTFILADINCYLSALKSWHNNLFLSGVHSLYQVTRDETLIRWTSNYGIISMFSIFIKIITPWIFWIAFVAFESIRSRSWIAIIAFIITQFRITDTYLWVNWIWFIITILNIVVWIRAASY